MPKINADEQILLHILALDKGFKDYEFYHCLINRVDLLKQASSISFDDAYLFLRRALQNLDNLPFTDEYPYYRKTYIKDLLTCVLAQADFFVYKKTVPFTRLEQAFIANPLPKPFDAQKVFDAAQARVAGLSGLSIKQMRSRRGPFISGFKNIKKYALNTVEDKINILAQYADDFEQFNLREIISKMRIEVVNRTPNGAPCCFQYKGGYRGVMGLLQTQEAGEPFLNGFILHEGVPGHFLYYCIKQYLADNGKTDSVALIDNFYSPENCINEGLAVCADLVFNKLSTPAQKAVTEAEQALHKLIYNLWYGANISGADTALERSLIKQHFNLKGGPARLIKYFTVQEKYYTPFYPCGIHFAQKYIPRLSAQKLNFLYSQHSINTLKKLAAAKEQK